MAWGAGPGPAVCLLQLPLVQFGGCWPLLAHLLRLVFTCHSLKDIARNPALAKAAREELGGGGAAASAAGGPLLRLQQEAELDRQASVKYRS